MLIAPIDEMEVFSKSTPITRLACVEDLSAIGQLLPDLGGPRYRERFPQTTSAEFCRWKYFTNPVGPAAVGVALDAGRAVSVVAGVPKRVLLGGGEVVLAVELGDFITAAEFRNRGLFSALIELVCDAALRMGAAFVYVRPNDRSFPILASRLGFTEVNQIIARRYVVPSAVMQRRLGIPVPVGKALGADWMARQWAFSLAPRSVAVERIYRFDQDFDRLWERTQGHYSFSLVRNSLYLNWRFAGSPTPYLIWAARRDGCMVGYVVALPGHAERSGTIVDLFADPGDEDAVAALLRVAFDSLRAAGADVIYTWTVRSGAESAADRLLRRACAFATKPPLHLAMRFLQRGFGTHSLPSCRWQLSTGDFDGI